MNKIISFSLTEKELLDLEMLSNILQIKSKSEIIRAAIESLSIEKKDLKKLKGKTSALLIIIHNHSQNLLKIIHEYQEIIKTQTHTHASNERCVDLLILEGEANIIKQISLKMQKDRRTILSKLILI